MVKNMPQADLMGRHEYCAYSRIRFDHMSQVRTKLHYSRRVSPTPHFAFGFHSGWALSLLHVRRVWSQSRELSRRAAVAASAAYNALQKPYFIHSLIVQDRFEILAGITFSMRRLPLCLSNYTRVFPGNSNFAAQRMPLDRVKRIGINLKLKLFVT